MTRRKRPFDIAVLGGNFAGLSAALALPRKANVTLVNQSPAFEWTPNIHELVSGVKVPEHLRIERATLVQRRGHTFRQTRILDLALSDNRVELQDGDPLAYDACIVAIGGDTQRERVPGAAEHAIAFRTVDDCHRIQQRLQQLERQPSFTVTIIGAGVSGVEALGELLRAHRDHTGLEIHVVEAGSRVMPEAPAELDEDIRAHCGNLPVRFHCGVHVEKISGHSVWLSNQCLLPSDLTIWTAGQAMPVLLERGGLADADGVGAPVRPTLQSAAFRNVFVAGDCALLKRPVKRQAYHAIEMGEHAAANVQRYLCGRKLKKYRPSRKPILVAFGDLDTYLVAGKRVIAGRSFAGAKEALFQGGMALFAPPLKSADARQVYKRFSRSMTHLLMPQFESLEDAMALGRYRWVS